MRVKVTGVTLIGMLASSSVLTTWRDALLTAVAIAAVLALSPGLRLSAMVFRLRPFVYFAVLTVVFGGLGEGATLAAIGPLHWSYPALQQSALAGVRLLFLGAVFAWLTLFVGTAAIVRMVWRGGRWAERLGIDLSSVLIGVAVAVRFLPLVQEEVGRLRLAWDARGAQLLARHPVGMVRYATGLVVPIMASALRRAEAFAAAVEVRSAGQDPGLNLVDVESYYTGDRSRESPRMLLGGSTALWISWAPVILKALWMLR